MRDFETMPKVELHLHLEGAIPVVAMWALAEAKGDASGVGSMSELRERFAYRDFRHFIETWVWKNQLLDSYEAFIFVAESVAADLARQQIVYAEVYFSPTDFAGFGLEPGPLAMAIRTGLDRVPGTRIALVADLVRDTGPQRAARTLDRVAEVADEAGIIGITIGGSEADFPASDFGAVFARARRAGFRLSAHAGEAAGPQSVWSALDVLRVDRIGHGIRSVEDHELVSALVARRVPLEICPTSNVRTGVVTSWEHHPVGRLVKEGAVVTLNTDDPAMFDCSLAGEYRKVSRTFGFDDGVMRRLALNAVDACWAEPAVRDRLRDLVVDWWERPGA